MTALRPLSRVIRRSATATLAAAIAAGSIVLPAAPAMAAAPAVTIVTPMVGQAGLQAGLPFTVTAQSSTDAAKMVFSATGCVFTPATVLNVTGGTDVSVTANCPVGSASKTVSVKATNAAGEAGTGTRAVSFDTTTAITPVITLSRAALPMCLPKGTYTANVSTPGGAPVMGVTVTGALSTAAGPLTVSGKTNQAGNASFSVTLADTSTMSVSSTALGAVAAAGPTASQTLSVDSCSLKTTILTSPPASATYLAPVTITGKTEFLRASDGALAPAGSSSILFYAGGKLSGKGKSLADGTFTATFPLIWGGQWTAAAKTGLAGVTPNTSTGVGGTTTIVQYNGTMSHTDPVLPKVGYYIAGSKTSKTTATLVAKNPDDNTASEIVNNKVNLKGYFELAGETGGATFGLKMKTGKGGVAKTDGVIAGNGNIKLDVDTTLSPGVDMPTHSIPVSAQSRVRLWLSSKGAPETGKVIARVTAYPLLSGTATLETQAGKDLPWVTWTTVPLNAKTSLTVPTSGTYKVRAVVAATPKADAGTSKALSFKVIPTPLSAQVTDLQCESTGGAAPVCTWTQPLPAVGQNVTGYTVKVGSVPYTITDPNTTTFTVPDSFTSPDTGKTTLLWSLGKTTKVTVTPTVDAGKFAASSAAPSTPQATPTDYLLRQTGTTAELTWKAVKSATEGYWLVLDTNAPVSAQTLGYTFKGLNAAPHTFTIYAKNTNGDTSAPAVTSLAATAVVPDAPASVNATPANGSVDLDWPLPVSDGYSPITDYVVQYRNSPAGPWTTFADGVSTTPSATVTGLANGVAYDFQVAAVNVVGTGAYSPSTTATPRTVPGVPTALMATGDLASVVLDWTAPASNGGTAITDYVIEYSDVSASSGFVTYNDGVGTTTNTTVTGLTAGQQYWFKVSAVNAVGTGNASSVATATAFNAASAPTITGSTPTLTTVALTWTAPSSNGGSPITDYVVEYSSVSASSGFVVFNDGVGTGLSATVTGLTAGTPYWFRVHAINAVGAGANSAVQAQSTALPLSLSYATTQFARNQSGQQLSPTPANGTAPYTYSVSGTLPTGVTFNTSTGVFTGPNLNDYVNGDVDETMLAAQGTAANNTVRTAAQNSDGTYLLGGAMTTWNGTSVGRLVKLNTNGTIDTTFNTNIGTGANNDIYTIDVQANGQILVGGAFTSWNGTSVGRLVRLNSDGTRDTTFSTNLGTGATNGVIHEVLELADNDIAVTGTFTTVNGNARGKFVRLNANGTDDTAFNANINNGTQTTALYAVAQQSSGKLLVGGQFNKWGTGNAWNIIRLNTDGTRDTTFDTGKGQAATGTVRDIAIQSDGKYIVAGAITAWDGTAVGGVVRLNANDTNDTTFFTNTTPGVSTGTQVNSIAISSTGKIMLAGTFTTWGGSGNPYIVWLNSTGTEDTAWAPTGPNGAVETAIYQASGLPLAVGSFATWNGTTVNRVAFMRVAGQRPTPGFPAALTVTVNDAGGQSANASITLTVAP